MRHLELMNKFLLLTSLLVGYAYAMEFFIAWYSGNRVRDGALPPQPADGPVLVGLGLDDDAATRSCPRSTGSSGSRTSIPVMFVVSILINIGMWFERFVIIVLVAEPRLLAELLGPVPADDHRRRHVRRGRSASSSRSSSSSCAGCRWSSMAEVKGTMPQADPHHKPEDEPHHAAPKMAPEEPPPRGGLVPEGAE